MSRSEATGEQDIAPTARLVQEPEPKATGDWQPATAGVLSVSRSEATGEQDIAPTARLVQEPEPTGDRRLATSYCGSAICKPEPKATGAYKILKHGHFG